MPQYIVELPTIGDEIWIVAKNDKMAKKNAQKLLAKNGILEYKWWKDATYRVLALYKYMGDYADVTQEHICDIEELVGSGNLTGVELSE